MSANMHLTASDLRHLADALDKAKDMRWRGIQPGNYYEEPRISHGDTTFRLTWVDEEGTPSEYAITEAEG